MVVPGLAVVGGDLATGGVSTNTLLKWSSRMDWSDSGSLALSPRAELRLRMMFLAAALAGKLATELSASIWKGRDVKEDLQEHIFQALFLSTFSVVFRTLLHASTMSQTIPDIHGSSQIFPVSERMSFERFVLSKKRTF